MKKLIKIASVVLVAAIVVVVYFISSYPSTAEIKNKIEGFLSNPEMCASENKEYYEAAKNINWNSESMILVEDINAMPKKITYFIQDKSLQKNIASLSYRVDAGCAGVWMTNFERASK